MNENERDNEKPANDLETVTQQNQVDTTGPKNVNLRRSKREQKSPVSYDSSIM